MPSTKRPRASAGPTYECREASRSEQGIGPLMLADAAHPRELVVMALLAPETILAAASRVSGFVHRTRLIRSGGLSRMTGGDVRLKLENEQITGSFKVRGAMNVLAVLDDATRARGVVASSAGNHGLGVAYAAKHFGVAATIFI